MPSVSSRIWIRVTVPISYADNHYTTDTTPTVYEREAAYCICQLYMKEKLPTVNI